MIYIIHRKHVFDGGSMRSWNAVTAYSEVYRTGIKNMVWSKDFHYKREATAWCKENGLPYMTEKEWNNLWLSALDEAEPIADDFYRVAAGLLNRRVFAKNPSTKLLKNGKVKFLNKRGRF